MKIVFGVIRIFFRLAAGFLLLLFIVIAIEYITCPIYTFHRGTAFEGNEIYNPYQNMDAKQWHKANFQVQSYAWGGLTSGSKNTNQDIYDLYSSLGYDIIATSDYEKINYWAKDKPGYIPVYEHGYGIKKWHQVLLGSNKVLWSDYPLFQSLSNKQHIINKLRADNELIYIAHPLLRHAYSADNFKKLGNFDGLEVLNNHKTSITPWDAALSSGNYVTILGNDDAHDISNHDEIGRHFTFVNCRSLDKKDIIAALKAGSSFGVKMELIPGEGFEAKRARAKKLPMVESVQVIHDSLIIAMDTMASEFLFRGQDGKIVGRVLNAQKASLFINPEITYVRTEVIYRDMDRDHVRYFLNPVCRFDGTNPGKMPLPTINQKATSLLRIMGFATLLFLLLNIIILNKRFSKKRK